MSQQIENAIREKRTNLAVSKNLMGPTGKFGTILRAFGTNVTRQGSGFMDVMYLEDPYGVDDVYTEYSPTMSNQEGPIMYRDEILPACDENQYYEGIIFDGLSRGLHFEIVYWQGTNELKVSYKGYTVYREISGILEGYAPFDDWENITERLYRAAKESLKSSKKYDEQAIARFIEVKKEGFWHRMMMKWGIK